MTTVDPLVIQLTAARKAAGLSLRAVAAAIGCPPSQLSGWEHGKWPRDPEDLRRWAQALGYEPVLSRLVYRPGESP